VASNFKHQVVLRGNDDDDSGYNLIIKRTTEDQPLFSQELGGYAAFGMATEPLNFKCLWSPDSKLVAIFQRGGKRIGDTTTYAVNGDQVRKIPLPDVLPRIRPHLTAELRALWVPPEVWLPDHDLILTVTGTQLDEAHGIFRFILTLQLRPAKNGTWTTRIASFRQDRSIDFSVK
jgi:hypothetical protein